MNMSWIVVAYYTPSYKGEISKLRQSMEDHDVPFYIEGIEDQGGWDANTHYKPTFIKRCMDLFPNKDIVYVDADATFEAYPDLFDLIDCDLAYWVNTYPNGRRNELCAGTLFLANNDIIRKLCDTWVEKCKVVDEVLEQIKLQEVVRDCKGLCTITLPIE